MKNKFKVAIVDYEMGNLFSVKRACEHIGLSPVITSDILSIMNAEAIILPGVGAFGDAMENLIRMDLVLPIREFVCSGKPFMGICLGMQLIFSESEEFGMHQGLDIVEGSVKKFSFVNNKGEKIKVPHVGWNKIFEPNRGNVNQWKQSPLENINNGEYMYFVHSYYAVPKSDSVILSITDYEGTEFCSSILWKNVFACQFHPEKSTAEGIKIYENWASKING